MPKYLKIFLLIFLLAIIIVVSSDIFSKNPQAEGFFVVLRGDNVLQIANNLQNQGFIGSKIIFIWDAVTLGDYRKMKAGRYQIKKYSTDKELIKQFTAFNVTPVRIMIAPGKTSKDIAQILSQANLANKTDFLNLVLNNSKTNQSDFYLSISKTYSFLSDKPENSGLEGYLFPDSYLFDPSESNQNIVKQILDNFNNKLTPDMRAEIKRQKLSIFEVVTMASILEKEVKSYSDKQIVAGILWKRIKYNLPLEVDSTSLYFLTSPHPSIIDKNIDSPYNTYNNLGLPAGPICNPGLDSIMAAIYSKNSDYWFYLSAPSGETIFAKTLGQHLINKAKYLSN